MLASVRSLAGVMAYSSTGAEANRKVKSIALLVPSDMIESRTEYQKTFDRHYSCEVVEAIRLDINATGQGNVTPARQTLAELKEMLDISN